MRPKKKKPDKPPDPPIHEQDNNIAHVEPALSLFDIVYSTDTEPDHTHNDIPRNPFIPMSNSTRRKSFRSNNPFYRTIPHPSASLEFGPRPHQINSSGGSEAGRSDVNYDHSSTTTNSHNSSTTVTTGSHNVTNYITNHYHYYNYFTPGQAPTKLPDLQPQSKMPRAGLSSRDLRFFFAGTGAGALIVISCLFGDPGSAQLSFWAGMGDEMPFLIILPLKGVRPDVREPSRQTKGRPSKFPASLYHLDVHRVPFNSARASLGGCSGQPERVRPLAVSGSALIYFYHTVKFKHNIESSRPTRKQPTSVRLWSVGCFRCYA
ncbi:hypothetical protein CC1G_05312 [Coprinopsis cinerea okayama7|uniref:Uncharacterized protein n=1 Tax=Coprinopsis cinerea (strain Okayama-7 / 130 / ATCC MYA-4618 / FGSC 9003) TaxID=240176 RepID=A8PCL2_COPC7|nr:hypothetical protein CC1G_05312 [Coprinopsis cinerea okayama7\|eukprot:XP_001840426.2 hypothetical protein CC1G_05312 [Coprinopsis cinerea okayama7\